MENKKEGKGVREEKKYSWNRDSVRNRRNRHKDSVRDFFFTSSQEFKTGIYFVLILIITFLFRCTIPSHTSLVMMLISVWSLIT